MNYFTSDGIVHAQVTSPVVQRSETIRLVHFACGGAMGEYTSEPPWIYKHETRRSPTCVRCMGRLLDDLKR